MTETAIIGGGPAGAAAAIALARAGRPPLLLERDAAPREAVCGEFLGPDAAAALARLGLDLPSLGAVPLRGLLLGAGRREASLDLPFPAWALPRRLLDGALRQAAAAAGARIAHGAHVRAAVPVGAGWHLRIGDGGSVAARRVLLATGKHLLRGHPRAPAPAAALGLKLHLRDVAMPPAVALLPFAGGYAGLLPTPEPGGANLCAALHGPPGEAARDAAALIARVAAGSALAARLLRSARPAWARPLAIGAVPYGFRHPGAGGPPGLWRVGDQLAVIPSFTGDGVAMALLSGLAAAEAITAGRDAPAFHGAWRQRSAAAMRLAGLGAWAMRRWPGGFVAAAALAPPAARALARATRMPAPPGSAARSAA